MVREIVKDEAILSQKAEPATEEDKELMLDLIDTLRAHRPGYVGISANMIGVNKAILAVSPGPFLIVMINPKVIAQSGKYPTKENCPCFKGWRSCERYNDIEVEYLDRDFRHMRSRYSGYIAQIIQHQLDHLEGILI